MELKEVLDLLEEVLLEEEDERLITKLEDIQLMLSGMLRG